MLLNQLKQSYSKLIKEAVKMIHNRQYIDHYWYFKSNPESMNQLVEKERKQAQDFYDQTQIKNIFKDYYNISYARKDGRQGDVPEFYDDYLYSSKYGFFDTGNDYMIIEREKKGFEKEVILDLKDIPFLKRYQATLKMIKMQISDDHRMIGFGVDLLNNEDVMWMFKYIDDDQILRTKLFECFDAKFTKDGKHIVYTEFDDKFRPYKLMVHKIGTTQEEDKLIYEEKDEQFYLDIQQSKDKEYFILLSQSKQENEVFIMKRDDLSTFKLLFPRKQNIVQYVQHHHKEGFYVLSNENAYDFKVLKQDNQNNKFKTFYEPQEGEVLQEVDLFENHLVLYFTKDSEGFIRVINLNNQELYNISIPSSLVYTDHEKNKKSLIKGLFDKIVKKDQSSKFLNLKIENEVLAATISPGVNHNYNSNTFNFHLSTPLVYDQVYQFNLSNKTLSKLSDCNLTGKPFLREQYTCTRIEAPTKDGNMIPITLVHKKDIKLNRQNKLLLHCYGAYGVAQDVPFNVVYLNALEKGWVLAYAHLRGGNERGQNWHKQAIKENKIKSIDDLIACAAHLVRKGYTHPALLCGLGASAGATTLGAAINMRPDIWKCAVLLSPFLDVTNSLLDQELPLTKSDYLEFGNPEEKKYFDSILSYSPYDNLKKQVYPAIYISAGQDDFRAPLWNVMKYVAKFRGSALESERVGTATENNLVVDIVDGGHFGGAGAQSVIEERTRYMTFLEYYVGIGNKEASIENLTQSIDESIVLEDEKQ